MPPYLALIDWWGARIGTQGLVLFKYVVYYGAASPALALFFFVGVE